MMDANSYNFSILLMKSLHKVGVATFVGDVYVSKPKRDDTNKCFLFNLKKEDYNRIYQNSNAFADLTKIMSLSKKY